MLSVLGIAVLVLAAFALVRSLLPSRDGEDERRTYTAREPAPRPLEPATGRAPVEEVVRDPALLAMVDRDELIAAIKVVRERTGLGLKESKDVVDELREKRGK